MTATSMMRFISRLGQSVNGQQPMNRLWQLMEAEFPAAFSQMEAQVFLSMEGHFIPQLGVNGGNEDGHFPRAKLDETLNSSEFVRLETGNEENGRWLFPVQSAGRPAAVLAVQAPFARLGQEQEEALRLLAQHLGVILAYGQMNDVSLRRSQQLARVSQVAELITTSRPLAPTMSEIHQYLGQIYPEMICFIALYDSESGQVNYAETVNKGELVPSAGSISIDDERSIVAWAIREKRPFIINSPEENDTGIQGINVNGPAESIICYPMQINDEILGVLSVQSLTSNAFDQFDRYLISLLAGHIASIIKNIQLFTQTSSLVENTAQQYRMAETLRRAVSVVSNSLDLKLVLDHLLSALREVIEFDSASIALLRDGRVSFSASYGFTDQSVVLENANSRLPASEILKEITETKRSIVLPDVHADPRWIVVKGAEHVRSWIAAPLLVGDRVLGVLMIDSQEVGAYSDKDEWMVSTLAAHAAIAVQNARLHEEVQRQLAELTTLYEATANMTAELDQSSVLESVVREMVKALHVDGCTMFVWDNTQDRLQLASHANRQAADGDEYYVGLSWLDDLDHNPLIRQILGQRQPRNLLWEKCENQIEKSLLEAAGLRSLLLLPLVWRNQILGLLALGQQDHSRVFNDQEMRLANNLSRQAAVAIEHADLFSKAQRRIEELSAFHDIALQLNTPLELSVVLDIITESALKLIEANNVHIYLYDEEHNFIFGSALSRDGSRSPAVSQPRDDGITATTARNGKPIIIADAVNHPMFQTTEASAWGIGAIAAFPLRRGERVLGVFTLTYLQKHVFTDAELLLLSLLADQAAVAVENARLFANAQRRLRDMSALVDMAQEVTGNLKVELVMKTTVEILRGLLDARASSIALLSDEGRELVIEAAAGIDPKWVHNARMKIGEGVSGQAVSERRSIYIADTHRQPDFLFFDKVVRSLIAVPLVSRDEAIGAMTVDSDKPGAFTESDIQLMTVAAAQVSTAIANARLFEEAEDRAAKLAVAYEELKENDRLKDELVQNVSHELRTPLTFVKGYVDLLMEGEMGTVSKEQSDTLRIVADKTVEITRLIDDIMSLQRIDIDNLILERFSLVRLIDETIFGHSLNAGEKGLYFEFEAEVDDDWLLADKGRVTQVLDNLIVNAMKFSPNGGRITVTVSDDGSKLTVMVKDQGIGLPKDKQERIFERFYQVDGTSRRRFGGAGIGLAIVKRIIDAHQGKIWVESEVNKGSQFYFSLPKPSDD